jgi:hypothetical protein
MHSDKQFRLVIFVFHLITEENRHHLLVWSLPWPYFHYRIEAKQSEKIPQKPIWHGDKTPRLVLARTQRQKAGDVQ